MDALDRDAPGTGAWDTTGPSAAMARRVVAVIVIITALAALVVGSPLASGEITAPPWRSVGEATEALAQARAALGDALDERDRTVRRLETLRARELSLDAENLLLAENLHATRQRALKLAIESYISGGELPDAIYLLDSVTANDFAYRSTLLSEGAGAVSDSTDSYVSLREGADVLAVDLAERIGRLERALVVAAEEIEAAEVAITDAEEVVLVAEIHAQADRAFADSGRFEPTEAEWHSVRECEAAGDYATATGNGFWGAYQFTLDTWASVGGEGLPSAAIAPEQDARARLLFALRGANPWPRCGRHLPGE